MYTLVAFDCLATLVTFRSRALQAANALVEDWYTANGSDARVILRLSLRGFASLPSLDGGSMLIFFWIVVGTIAASTTVALLCRNRSNTTLSEIADKLERQAAARNDLDRRSAIGDPPPC
jgi:hypothetical protein